MSDEIAGFLAEYDPPVRDIARELRALIRGLAPDAHEKLYSGYRNVGYHTAPGRKNQFCAIAPQRGYVNIYFPQGILLDDPAHLLEGTGKSMRHVKVRTAELINAPALSELILQAIRLRPIADPAADSSWR